MTSCSLLKLFLSLCGIAGLVALSPGSAHADPKVAFVYRTLIDATPAGGAPDTPLTVTYTFRPNLRSLNDSTETAYYTPVHVRIELGDETFETRHGGAIAVADYDEFDDYYLIAEQAQSTSRGSAHSIDRFQLLLEDSDAAMFDDPRLPLSPDFAREVDYHELEIVLLTPEWVTLRILDRPDAPPEERTPFTLEQMIHK